MGKARETERGIERERERDDSVEFKTATTGLPGTRYINRPTKLITSSSDKGATARALVAWTRLNGNQTSPCSVFTRQV